jgi:flagellar protein FliL
MKRLIIPIILFILGTAGGIGAGLALVPPPPEETALGPCGEVSPDADHTVEPEAHASGGDNHAEEEGHEGLGSGSEYVKLNNQFIVPIVQSAEVAALVIMSISVEVPAGQEDAVLQVEPKLRDVFLQVLFDHANTGGFEGMFTSSSNMRSLRIALRTAAQDAFGETITDVLIVDLVRQDV